MSKLLDELLEVVDSGNAPAPGLLSPNHDVAHDYYLRLLDIIRAAEQTRALDGAYRQACKVCGRPVMDDGHIDVADIDGVVTITAAYCAEDYRKLGEASPRP